MKLLNAALMCTDKEFINSTKLTHSVYMDFRRFHCGIERFASWIENMKK